MQPPLHRRPILAIVCLAALGLLQAPAVAQVPDADADGLPDEWEVRFGLDPASAAGPDGAAGDPDRDGMANAAEFAAGSHPRGTTSRSFAEGATGPFFDVRFALFNADATNASRVLMRFMTSAGNVVSHHVTLEPLARATVDPETLPGLEAAAFSTVVEADTEVVADRTMSWDADRYGSHAETAVTGPALVWFLAEGATHSGFALFYLLQNPGAAAADVTITYLLPSGSPLVRRYEVAPRSRFNVWVDVEDPTLASTDVSATITSSVPIVVERAMYLDAPGQQFAAGHASAGVTAPATQWFLAEGATGQLFDLFVLLANPAERDAAVTATFLLPDGSTVTTSTTVAARTRATLWVDNLDPRLANTAVSTTVTSTNGVPIIVERAMWWPGGDWREAHNSAGATGTGTVWALAEGEVGGVFKSQTYVLIANASSHTGSADVSLHFEDGGTASRSFTVGGNSRFTVDVAAEFAAEFTGGSRRFATLVRSTGTAPVPLVVERAMYSDARGVAWAAGTNALGTRVGPTAPGAPGGGGGVMVSIAATDGSASEQGTDPGVFTLTRSSSAGALTIPILFGGTASAGDLATTPVSVTFPAGQSTAQLVVTPVDDALVESEESVVVTIAIGPGYSVGQASAAVRLADNEGVGPEGPSEQDAVRLLDQAAFGPTMAAIVRVRELGYDGWITEQMNAPQSGFLGYLDAVSGETLSANHVQEAWFQAAIAGPDQLRQRVANALLEIMVVGSTNGLEGASHAHAAYMDVLMRNAFGNFRTLLEHVTLNPAMGRYLDMLRSQREDPASGRNPSENYARELLQLFSIGLYQLHPDGTMKIGADGQPIPTYGQAEVEGFARVFTGWTMNQVPLPAENFFAPSDWRNPMVPMSRYHSYSAKTLLDGEVIPVSTFVDPEGDLRKALDNVFRHPNVGPFIGRQLIQRLVTSNPSPGYVDRVARVFDDNGMGVRGDLAAVVRAILLDVEARSAEIAREPVYGHLREPMIRFVALVRAFNGRAASQKFRIWNLQNDMGQAPFRSPSVFNFFAPDYARPGEIADAGLVSPEFQITSETTTIRASNTIRNLVYRGYGSSADQIVLDFSAEQALAATPPLLVDRLDTLLFAGRLSSEARTIVVNAVAGVSESRPLDRVRMAVYLLVTSPEYLIQK
jgi:uncharacterized protein (DUF1800 family)